MCPHHWPACTTPRRLPTQCLSLQRDTEPSQTYPDFRLCCDIAFYFGPACTSRPAATTPLVSLYTPTMAAPPVISTSTSPVTSIFTWASHARQPVKDYHTLHMVHLPHSAHAPSPTLCTWSNTNLAATVCLVIDFLSNYQLRIIG